MKLKLRYLMIPAACVPLTIAGLPTGAWSASTAADAPTAATATGTLASGMVANDGTAIGHASVVAVAWPRPEVLATAAKGATFTLPVVARTKTDAAGRFTLRLDETSLPARFRGTGGQVDIEMIAADSVREVHWRQTVTPSGAANVQSVAGPSGTVPASFTFDLGRRPSVLEGSAAGSGTNTLAAAHADSGGAAKSYATAAARRPCGSPLSVTMGPRHNGLREKFMKVLAWSGAKATVEQTTSSTHQLGVGAKYSGENWSASGKVSVQTRIEGGASTDNVADAYVWNKVNYRDIIVKCIAPSGGWTRTDRTPTGFNDLNADFTRAPHTNLRFCATKLPGKYWKTRGRNTTFETGVDMGPISVSAQAGFDSNTKLQYVVTRKSKLCGNSSAGWLSSSQIESRRP
ncbi:hypothetical protein [Actinomadura alba]|uniref:Uncharacterized protein n=1 Tax=Actinomadura alba TaxID=406431 RepID=A0ABR7LJP8_9ACTN|nr:hypothetical protein [Actinomadura alba]MBC6465077.1 hypothetical protein [Actinomadura alba]